MKLNISRYQRALSFMFIFLFISFIIRSLLLMDLFTIEIPSVFNIIKIYSVGIFFDIITFFYLIIPLIIYLIIIPEKIFKHKLHKYFLKLIYFIFINVIVFSGFAEWLFFQEFGVRFNFIAVDYLVYTREVIGNIVESYPLIYIFPSIGIISLILFFFSHKLFDKEISTFKKLRYRFLMGIIILLIPLFSFIFIDNSLSEISGDRYINNLAQNGIYDLFAAFRNNELDYYNFYKTIDDKEAFKNIRKYLTNKKTGRFSDNPYSIEREIKNNPAIEEKKYNIVIITVESLSARFLGVFGNKDNLTPYLDKIAKKSLLFTRFYATGTRTVRGLEALSLSYPPTPGRSVIKRKNNENMPSIVSKIFEKRGYISKFIYGGYGYFDNMNYFFENNGFKIVDRASIPKEKITFGNIWGICDEDLLNAVGEEADRDYKNNKPFFYIVMTTSNHRPYTYPEGKIDIPPKTGRPGGVKYTDYAIGNFLKNSENKEWFKNTIFVIVADHCGSSSGRSSVNIKRHHIPLIIYAPEIIKPGIVNKLSSQIDVTPTLLDILNWQYKSGFFGKSILKMNKNDEKAFIGTYQKLGFLKDNIFTELSAPKKVKVYKYDYDKDNLEDYYDKNGYISEAVSYYQTAAYLLKQHKLK